MPACDHFVTGQDQKTLDERVSNMKDSSIPALPATSKIPPDDIRRDLTVARPETDQKLPHISVAGNTYTILLTSERTAGRTGGGPLVNILIELQHVFAVDPTLL